MDKKIIQERKKEIDENIKVVQNRMKNDIRELTEAVEAYRNAKNQGEAEVLELEMDFWVRQVRKDVEKIDNLIYERISLL